MEVGKGVVREVEGRWKGKGGGGKGGGKGGKGGKGVVLTETKQY